MNFRKKLRKGGGHFRSEKFHCKFSAGATGLRKKSQYIFRKRGGGVKGRLEIFRKFIHFGVDRLPLLLSLFSALFFQHFTNFAGGLKNNVMAQCSLYKERPGRLLGPQHSILCKSFELRRNFATFYRHIHHSYFCFPNILPTFQEVKKTDVMALCSLYKERPGGLLGPQHKASLLLFQVRIHLEMSSSDRY